MNAQDALREGRQALAAGEPDRAVRLLQQAADGLPDDPRAWAWLAVARCFAVESRPAEALSASEMAQSKGRWSMAAYLSGMIAHLRQKPPEGQQALDCFTAAWNCKAEDPEEAALAIACTMLSPFASGHIRGPEDDQRITFDLGSPTFQAAWRFIAGRPRDALEQFRSVARQTGAASLPEIGMALCYVRLGERGKAAGILKRALNAVEDERLVVLLRKIHRALGPVEAEAPEIEGGPGAPAAGPAAPGVPRRRWAPLITELSFWELAAASVGLLLLTLFHSPWWAVVLGAFVLMLAFEYRRALRKR